MKCFQFSGLYIHVHLLPSGLLTCCPGTGPVLPSLPWLAVARPLARLTCTAASTLCSTPSLPATSGLKTLICAWTLPWKSVSYLDGVQSKDAWGTVAGLTRWSCFFCLQASTASSLSPVMWPLLWLAGDQGRATPTPWESSWCLELYERTGVTAPLPSAVTCLPMCRTCLVWKDTGPDRVLSSLWSRSCCQRLNSKPFSGKSRVFVYLPTLFEWWAKLKRALLHPN